MRTRTHATGGVDAQQMPRTRESYRGEENTWRPWGGNRDKNQRAQNPLG